MSIKDNRKLRFLLGIIGVIVLCAIFFVIYFYVSPKEKICILKQETDNYTNSIKVRIVGKNATTTEIFKSKEKLILNYKNDQNKKDGYHVTKSNNKLISTKKISGKKLLDKYIASGYDCNKDYKKKKILFSLKELLSKLEVKSEYKEVFDKVEVDGKDYTKKVKTYSNLDINKIGKYVINYQLKISKYRYENVYKIIDVVDTTAPTLILKDASTIYVNQGEEFNDPGVEVSDNYDYKADLKVNVEGSVDTNVVGEYKLVYTVEDSSHNKSSVERVVVVKVKETNRDGFTYIDGVLIVNKKYSLPKDYAPGLLPEVESAYNNLAAAAKTVGYNIPLVSGFRSYQTQEIIYNNYISIYGKEATDTFSAQPGHSEHQSGLAMDVGKIDDDYGNTPEGIWLASNAHKYGFIIRYQKGKEAITGYKYEPWHIRYLGVDLATKVYNSGLCLEEYLHIS